MPVHVKLNKAISEIIKNCGINDATLEFAAQEARDLMREYVPMQTGELADTAQASAENGRGIICYTQPYAVFCYYGETKNFSRDRHEKATAYWDRAMLGSNRGYLTERVGNFIKK